MNRKLVVALMLIATFLTISAIPNVVLGKLFFRPNYTVTFSGDLDGAGPIMVTGNFKVIKTNTAHEDFTLVRDVVFDPYAGTNEAYIFIERMKKDPTVEFYITYNVGPRLFHHINGHGLLEGSMKAGWFRIDATGEYTLSKSGEVTDWEYVEIWSGFPSFAVEGVKLQ